MSAIVVGGGFAGLAAAARLAEAGVSTTVLEAAPRLGGRAASHHIGEGFRDDGPHVLMGCYKNALGFLDRIGSSNLVARPARLRVPFANLSGDRFLLAAANAFYPFDLYFGLRRFAALNARDRRRILSLGLRLPAIDADRMRGLSALGWLRGARQTPRAIEALWEPLGLAALNRSLDAADASALIPVLKKIFLGGSRAATIALPRVPFETLYCEPTRRFLAERGGAVETNERATRLLFEGERAVGVETARGTRRLADAIILALPAHALASVGGAERALGGEVPALRYSAIVSGYYDIDDAPFEEPFFGLLGARTQWVFRRPEGLATTTSDANDLADAAPEDIAEAQLDELRRAFGVKRSSVKGYRIFKDRRATFSPDAETLAKRPPTETRLGNVFLAGDWIDTGLPATIEGAALSGERAATLLLRRLRETRG
jgi:squalene-associated FAD-dependent desaturase